MLPLVHEQVIATSCFETSIKKPYIITLVCNDYPICHVNESEIEDLVNFMELKIMFSIFRFGK